MIEKLSAAIRKDQAMMNVLEEVRALRLPDCWVGAGFVRNKAWDVLHSYDRPLEFTDIDVVFFDSMDSEPEKTEKKIEEQLRQRIGTVKWEVINQTRTHVWHGRESYRNTTEAIADWIETATCVGVRLDEKDQFEFTAPHGFEDIESLVLRPVPSLKKFDVFDERMRQKNWLEKWPKLKVIRQQKLVRS